jgi:type II secretory pathway component PulJ
MHSNGMGHARLLTAVAFYSRAIQDATTINDRTDRFAAMMKAEQIFRSDCDALAESLARAAAYTDALNEEAGEKLFDYDHWAAKDDCP